MIYLLFSTRLPVEFSKQVFLEHPATFTVFCCNFIETFVEIKLYIYKRTIKLISLMIKYLVFVLNSIKYQSKIHDIIFLFTFYTTEQLFRVLDHKSNCFSEKLLKDVLIFRLLLCSRLTNTGSKKGSS